jgi:glutathione S-transferase
MENHFNVHYFEGNGRAANIRAILDFSNAKWENTLISFADWPALKMSGKFENAQLPAVEVNGKMLTQTLAIEIYLARLFNLMGSNVEDEFKINYLLCLREDFSKHLYSLLFLTEEQKEKREELSKDLVENIIPKLAKGLESKYVANGSGKYFLGDKFSLADIFLANTFTQLFESVKLKDLFGAIPSQHCPTLLEVVNRVKSEELKNYFEKTYNKNSFF